MIFSFIRHSSNDGLAPEKGQYLIHLLEAFINITRADYGIEPLLGKEAIYQFSNLFSVEYATNNLIPEDHRMICQLGLRVLGNLSINHDGK
jgi:hypothetical protein